MEPCTLARSTPGGIGGLLFQSCESKHPIPTTEAWPGTCEVMILSFDPSMDVLTHNDNGVLLCALEWTWAYVLVRR